MKLIQVLSTIKPLLPKKTFDIVLYAAFITAILVLFNLYASINDEGDWEKYKVEHHCQLKRTNNSTQQATWECDDGKTHYRWRRLR